MKIISVNIFDCNLFSSKCNDHTVVLKLHDYIFSIYLQFCTNTSLNCICFKINVLLIYVTYEYQYMDFVYLMRF